MPYWSCQEDISRSSDQPRQNNPSPSVDGCCNIAKAAQRKVPNSWPLMAAIDAIGGHLTRNQVLEQPIAAIVVIARAWRGP